MIPDPFRSRPHPNISPPCPPGVGRGPRSFRYLSGFPSPDCTPGFVLYKTPSSSLLSSPNVVFVQRQVFSPFSRPPEVLAFPTEPVFRLLPAT